MTVDVASFLDDLKSAAARADAAEADLRKDFSNRMKQLEQERAFAYRRYNLMRAIADGMMGAESEEIAVAHAVAVLRTRLGWHSDSEAHDAVLSSFAPVSRELFVSMAPPEAEAEGGDVTSALASFENWYAAKHNSPFWILFENQMPETPVVDF